MKDKSRPHLTFTGMRAAIDKLGFAYHTTFKASKWDELLRRLASPTGLVLPIKDENGDVTEFVLLPANNTNRIRQGTLVIADRHNFIRIIVTAPFAARVDGEREPYRSVLVEINGALFSSQISGISLVQKVRRGVEKLFFYDRGATASARRRALASSVRPTALHLCVDVAIGGKGRSTWIRESLFGNGSIEHIAESWPKRAERRGSITGTSDHGHTFTIGGRIARMNVYERDKSLAPKGKQRVRKDYERVLRNLGWDQRSRILRVEWQVRRSWFGTQGFVLADGTPRTGKELLLSELLREMPAVGVVLAKRYRHTEPGTTGRRDHRPESRFWGAVRAAIAALSAPGLESMSVSKVFARATNATTASRYHRAARLSVQLAKDGGLDGESMELEDVTELVKEQARTLQGGATYQPQVARRTPPVAPEAPPAVLAISPKTTDADARVASSAPLPKSTRCMRPTPLPSDASPSTMPAKNRRSRQFQVPAQPRRRVRK